MFSGETTSLSKIAEKSKSQNLSIRSFYVQKGQVDPYADLDKRRWHEKPDSADAAEQSRGRSSQ